MKPGSVEKLVWTRDELWREHLSRSKDQHSLAAWTVDTPSLSHVQGDKMRPQGKGASHSCQGAESEPREIEE